MSNVYNQGLILMHREWDRELSRKMGKSWEQVIYRRNKIVKKKIHEMMFDSFNEWKNET